MACICERQGYLEQAAGVYRCLLAEIRKYLSADLSYFLPEERDELGNLLRYYLDMIQRFLSAMSGMNLWLSYFWSTAC